MNIFRRFLALVATLIITSSLPLGAMQKQAPTTELCVICQEDITKPENSKPMKCGHIFHKNCIADAARVYKIQNPSNTTYPCPLCRKPHDIKDLLLDKKEFNTIERLNSLIEKISTGDLTAAQEIINNRELVSHENLTLAFNNACSGEYIDIIDLFIQDNTFLTTYIENEKLGAIVNSTLSKAFNTKNFAVFQKFASNAHIMNCSSIDQKLQKILMAIAKKDYLAFQNALPDIALKPKTLTLILTFAIYIGFQDIFIKFFVKENLTLLTKIDEKTIVWIFMYAAQNGQLETIKEFFNAQNVDLLKNIKQYQLTYAFLDAVQNGHLDIIHYFLNPQNIALFKNIHQDDLISTLIGGAENGHINIIEYFLNPKNPMSLKNIQKIVLDSIFLAAIENNHLPIIKYFLKPENIIRFKYTEKDLIGSALINAAKNNGVNIIEYFLNPQNIKTFKTMKKNDLKGLFILTLKTAKQAGNKKMVSTLVESDCCNDLITTKEL